MRKHIKTALKHIAGIVIGIEKEDLFEKKPISKMSKKEVMDELYNAIKLHGGYEEAKKVKPQLMQDILNRLDELFEQDILFI